jgi:aminopeptidase
LGTDLTVELAEKHSWVGGAKGKGALCFTPNIPTEEIFTLPKKQGVNGTVYSSMPLSLDGNLVKDIRFTVKDGKIVDAAASTGLETLNKKLDVDEGARYFGEAALVPHKSPISDMGILFYNTLYDENASCHFAFGKGYPVFTDAETASAAELKARGINDSFVHVDFMVGTPDLSITGITGEGKEIPVFINGNFAF